MPEKYIAKLESIKDIFIEDKIILDPNNPALIKEVKVIRFAK